MDPAVFFTALERLVTAGGMPAAVLGMVAYTWWQDRRRGPEHGGEGLTALRNSFAAFRETTSAKIVRLETQMEGVLRRLDKD